MTTLKVRLYQGLLELNWNLPLTLITLIVLYFILRKFLFKKVHDFMVARQNEIDKQYSEAEEAKEKAEAALSEYQAQLAGAEKEKDKIIREGREDAEVQANAILEDANNKARERYERAREEIRREREYAQDEMERQMTDLVVLATEKVLGENVSRENQEKLALKAIKEAEAEHENL